MDFSMDSNLELERVKNLPLSIELLECLQNGLISRATGATFDETTYKIIRRRLLNEPTLIQFVPSWIKDCRDVDQFWAFIKYKDASYQGRRNFIYSSFTGLFDYFEGKAIPSIVENIKFGETHIYSEWQKALDRKTTDPEAAITTARTLLETVFKYILDTAGEKYDRNIEIGDLYRKTTKILKMAPDDHQEPIFIQILTGIKSVVLGLSSLRNQLGDAHGKSIKHYKPLDRHSEFAVNLSGSVALFLYKTFEESGFKKEKQKFVE